jgi:hypothetical protein
VIGALPWLWANVTSGFASLTSPLSGLKATLTYGGRLSVFFDHALPIELGLQRPGTGSHVFGSFYPVALWLSLAVVAASLLLCILRGGPSLALAIGVMAFPFLYAFSPLSWFWQDSRYIVYLPALLGPVVVLGMVEMGRRSRLPSRVTVLGVSGLVLWAFSLTVVGAPQNIPFSSAFAAGWSNPDAPVLPIVARLERNGVRTGYADYWIAYKLDFLSKDALLITTAGTDRDRFPAIDQTVRRSPQAAWVFAPNPLPAEQIFGDSTFVVGPDGMTESQFLARLHSLGVPYRAVDAGILTAIIPSRTVTPTEVGL